MAEDDEVVSDNNQNQKKQKKEQGPKRPFYMVEPDSATAEFIKINTDGGYDVTVQVGLVNPQDKNKYTLVRFVNGKQVPGVITLSKDDSVLVFEKVKPNPNGDIRVGLALASHQDETAGISLLIPRKKIQGDQKAKTEKKARIRVDVEFPNADRVHQVRINLFDESGNPEEGEVRVVASQRFKLDNRQYTYSHQFKVPVTGLAVSIQPLQYNELFRFVAVSNGSSVNAQFLGKK